MTRLRRSRLYFSCRSMESIRQARGCGADVVVFDLEDTTPEAIKAAGRTYLAQALKDIAAGKMDVGEAEVIVRINHPSTPHFEEDLKAIARVLKVTGTKPDGVLHPKTTSPEEIHALEQRLSSLEKKAGVPVGTVKINPGVETAKGILNAYAIATASPRVVAINFSAGDFSKELGIPRTRGGEELSHARWHVLLAAKAAGVQAIDCAYWDKDDIEGWAQDARTAFRMGFDGKSLTNPKVVEPVHREYEAAKAAFLQSDERYWKQYH